MTTKKQVQKKRAVRNAEIELKLRNLENNLNQMGQAISGDVNRILNRQDAAEALLDRHSTQLRRLEQALNQLNNALQGIYQRLDEGKESETVEVEDVIDLDEGDQ